MLFLKEELMKKKKKELTDLWVEWKDKPEIDWSIVKEQVEED